MDTEETGGGSNPEGGGEPWGEGQGSWICFHWVWGKEGSFYFWKLRMQFVTVMTLKVFLRPLRTGIHKL